jgi:hypothetical protein
MHHHAVLSTGRFSLFAKRRSNLAPAFRSNLKLWVPHVIDVGGKICAILSKIRGVHDSLRVFTEFKKDRFI